MRHRAPKQNTAIVELLYALYDEHGDDAMKRAIRHVLRGNARTFAGVRRALQHALDAGGRS
ncbi:MAG: hypothetical protein KF901_15025 [Myxococcales bacterium]|nr:hypothetical protein [Myxococcales bacterium]